MSTDTAVVWYCNDIGTKDANTLSLPAWQRRRLDAMRHGRGRQLRAAAWWLANQLLAERLAASGLAVLWEHDAQGRPRVVDAPLQLSISHCAGGAVAACAVSPVGIDVECRGRMADWQKLSRRVFAPSEQAVLTGLPSGRRQAAALRLWSAREAWGKAGGQGIAALAGRPLFRWESGAWEALQGRFWQTATTQHVVSLAMPRTAIAKPPELFRVTMGSEGGAMPSKQLESEIWTSRAHED